MSTSSPRWKNRARAALPAAALALIALWEIGSVLGQGRAVPSPADWQAASAALRERRQAGELIVFAPGWVEPLGRLWLGDLIPLEMAGRMDAARYGVIWQLGWVGRRAPETAGLAPTASWRFGGLELDRFEQPAARIATDFVATFATAKATGRAASAAAVRLEEVGFAPHRCVEVVPQPDGTVEIAYPGARLGRQLVGYVGLGDVFTRRDVRDPARLEVAVGGRVIATTTVGVDDGWVRFAAATAPGPATVVFRASALGPRARDRKICFAAEARE